MKLSLAVVALVIVASAIVAVGASDFGLLLPAVGGSVGPSWLVRAGGGIAALAGLLLLIRQRTRNPPRGDRATDPTAAALGAAATIMCVLAVIALLSPRMAVEDIPDPTRRQTSSADSAGGEAGTNAALLPQAADPGGRGGGVGPSGGGGGRRQQPDRADAPGGHDIDGDLLSQLGDRLLLILLFVVAVVTFLALTGRFGRRSSPAPAEAHTLAAEDAEAVLRASLDAFDYTGDDPRLQITAIYHRLLRALAAAGAPREPQEAPYEYLRRALEPLGVTSQPMLELTELYVVAQFSELPITNQHRGRAIAALESALSDLRRVAVEQQA